MDTVAKGLRIAGTIVLSMTEVILVGLFITAVSRNSAHFIDDACLLFHCFALFTILSTIIYSMFNGHRNPTDKFYVLSTCFLVVATSISFLLVVIDTAKTTPNDFAGLGRPAAEAVIALSFMVVLLAMLALGITIYEKMHELPLVPPKHAEAGTDEAKHAPDGANRARAALSDMQAAAAGSSAGPDGHRRSVHFVVSDFKHVAHVGPDTLEQPQAIEPLDLETMEDVPLTPVDPSPRSEETVRLTVPEEAHTSATGKHRQMSYDLGYWSGIGRAV